MRLSFRSLRSRVMLIVLIAVIPAVGIMTYNSLAQRQDAVRRAQDETLNLVRLIAQEQSSLITSARQLLLSLSLFPELRHSLNSASCPRILARILKSEPHYSNLGVATPDGQVYCSAVPMKRPVNILDRDYFRRAVESRDFAMGAYQVGRITGIRTVNFSYPVLDASGKVEAVIYAALNLSWFNQMIEGLALPKGATVTVIDSHGTLLAHRPDPQKWVGRSMPGSPIARAMIEHRGDSTAEAPGLDGVERLYAFAPLYGASDDTYVGIGIPRQTVLAAGHREFIRGLSLLALAAILTLAAAWTGINRFVLRRLIPLIEAARRLGQGDLAARAGRSRGVDEISQLARTFDEMAEDVARTHRELKRINRALQTQSAGNQCLVRASDEPSLLDAMCRVIVETGGYRAAWVGYAQEDEHRTILPVAQAGYEEGYLAMLNLTWADTERGWGPAGTAIRTGEPSVAQDIRTDPVFAPWRDEALKRGYASCIGMPLRVHQKMIGALCLYAEEPDAFDRKEVALLSEMANDLAYGIETLRTRVAHEQAHETIRRMAYLDPLTGLPNHAQFKLRLQEAIAQAQTQPRSLAVLLVGLDRFREINDALGFTQGDVLLQELGERLRNELLEGGVVARMRGDEFAILLSDADSKAATQCAERIFRVLAAPFMLGALPVDVHASIGIALFPIHGTDAEQLVRRMDVAMNEAKKTGNRYALYAEEQDQDAARRLALASDLRRAIENDELELHFQPKIDIRSCEVCGVEALARWVHPEHGMLSPGEFIPLAEHTGLIRSLTEWALETAMRQCHDWHEAGLKIPVAVNLSARNLQDPRLLEKMRELSQKWAIGPGMLELEITESAIMEDPAGALDRLTQLHEQGMPIFVDDFGTGYSSLSYLQKLPVDALKIDKSFVVDMLVNKDSETIVRSTIKLAHDLGLKVVAEGVENQAMLRRLKTLDCDVAQGFYLGRPLPEGQFRDWLGQCFGGC
ncbi:MAG: bifunctional diguanylate cyclase/phosphodiesterase [Acidiferrobacterales bacterium]